MDLIADEGACHLKTLVYMILALLGMTLLAACGGADVPDTGPTRTPGPRIITNTPEPELVRPSEPAGADFRADPVGLVANTGNPQLVEVFSYD